MDFTVPADIEKLSALTQEFIAAEVMPLERDRANFDQYENIRLDLLEAVRKKAKASGVWAPQMPRARGGLGLSLVGRAALYEEANRSIFGPAALNCAAPDDGNMSLLDRVLPDESMKDKWLQPIIDGQVHSAFAMTEPAPGSGSDPGGMMLTRAERKKDKYVVHGCKWFISGAALASHFILVARTSDDQRRGLSAFLFHKDQPRWRIVRRIDILGPQEHGGVCELEFNGLEIPVEHRLLEEGDGLKITQIRLGPARLTHCMRWLGLAKRCLEEANVYVRERKAFGARLADHESVQLMLADVAREIHIGRLLTMHAAWLIDQGGQAQKEISMAKIHVANVLQKASDTALQLLGAKGYSKDTVVEWIYRYARAARLVDGASEVHGMVLARHYAKLGHDFWRWGSEKQS
jgi:acyl-CoA dehydrogenase